jgi:hypothetical protein
LRARRHGIQEKAMDTRDQPVSRDDATDPRPRDPAEHDAYWRENYRSRPYVEQGALFDDYGPAYRYGCDVVKRYAEKSFDEAEAEIRNDWSRARGASKLDWDRARHPVRDAWEWVKTHVDHD